MRPCENFVGGLPFDGLRCKTRVVSYSLLATAGLDAGITIRQEYDAMANDIAPGALVVCPVCRGEVPIGQAAARHPERPFRCDTCSERGTSAARIFIMQQQEHEEHAIKGKSDDNSPNESVKPGRAPSRAKSTKSEPAQRTVDRDSVREQSGGGTYQEEHGGEGETQR